MRPIRLQLKGFTAFREPAEIDFSDLDVFAIAGPTGSGKSSLLDAMTYALYGRVERVGDRVGQLISQGQPRMAVTLEFEVGRDRYRVTRSTPAKGATKILLERRDGNGGWVQAGEGADRVREAEHIIARAVGLSYDGFTRSVLLPQGKFAEFLVGDPKKRREILTELLGLSLFRRMAELAGAIGKESAVRSQERTLALEREYAGVTPQALQEARSELRLAKKREAALAEAGRHMVEVLQRWKDAQRSMDDLRACAEESGRAAERARDAADGLGVLSRSLSRAEEALEERVAEAKAARQAQEAAEAALREAGKTLGSSEELSNAQGRAHALLEAMRIHRLRTAELAEATGSAHALRQSMARAERTIAEKEKGLTAAQAAMAGAESALEEARHADLVTAVSAGLRAGDPCPVCGQILEAAPKRARGGALERAERAARKAAAQLERARVDLSAAERAADVAGGDLKGNEAERRRLAEELAELDGRLDQERLALHAVFGDAMPADPAAVIEDRLGRLRDLARAEGDALRACAAADQAMARAERERDRVAGLIDRHRERLAVDHQPLLDRAARAMGGKGSPVKMPAAPAADRPQRLRSYAEKLATALEAFTERLMGEVEARSTMEGRLLEEALERVGDLVQPAPSLQALAAAVNSACREATARVATTGERVAGLAERLVRRTELAQEVKLLDERSRVFKQLALELRADRLIAFLQAEALQVLAAAGSERLGGLSDGRYRLFCRGDEFFVIDTWNGDEERSVRTLSGGETFLASLSLALALADQVRSLSVTDRARLDSLFLDEGFGSLDQETLDVVVEAIERLAGDGRLVGIISHVPELANRLPQTVVVQKGRGGSRLLLDVHD